MLRNIIGPVFNFRNCVFFVVFLLVFQITSSFCRENEIFKNKKQKKQKMDQFLTLKKGQKLVQDLGVLKLKTGPSLKLKTGPSFFIVFPFL